MVSLQNLTRLLFLVFIMVSCRQWEYEKVDFIELDTGQVTATSLVSIEITGSVVGLDGGNLLEHGHCWSTQNSMPTIDDSRVELGSRATNGVFVSQLKALLPEQNYFIRAYAIYQGQAIYGETQSVTTSAIELSMDSIKYEGMREAFLTASIIDLPSQFKLLNHGFCWSNEIEIPTFQENNGVISLGAASGKANFSSSLTGLRNECTYYIRPFIFLPDQRLIYGNTQIFNAQLYNIWTLKNEFGGEERWDAVGFAIGQRGYVGLGSNNDFMPLQDFWEYDPLADSWTQKKDFAGGPRAGTIGFVINNKGYVGLGSNSQSFPGKQKDFWEYDPEKDDWTRLADFPGPITSQTATFVVDGKAYVGTGVEKGITDYQNRLWEYDPSIDDWAEKAPFPGDPRTGAVGFAIGKYGYIGFGANSKVLNDFYRYDPTEDDWDEMSSLDDELILNAASFTIEGRGYITGAADRTIGWAYDAASNNWIPIPELEQIRIIPVGFSINNRGYLVTGSTPGNTKTKDVWEYRPN